MSDLIVETTKGKVKGALENEISVFKGIPFAAPPTGELRFRPPQEAKPWTDVREATQFGPAAPQLPSAIDLLNTRELEMDEDCLSLNVFTPAADDAKRPVMVWIHGGAFITGTGSSPWYDGTAFTQRDSVVVTINYRLGALGFLYLDEIVQGAAGAANLGILDQLGALEWVRDNIAAFGGDPGNVTIFGESAGGMSVGTLLGTPAAKGLFRRAILESGAVRHLSPREEATRIAQEFIDELGLESPSLDELQTVPVQKLLEAQGTITFKYWGKTRGLPLQPVLDGVAIPQHPLEAIEQGSTAEIEILAGTTRDEWLLFALLDPGYESRTEDELVGIASKIFRSEELARKAIETYKVERPDATPSEILAAIQTDYIFRKPLYELLEKHKGTAYVYLFQFCSPVMEGRLGACHALEIPFVFDSLYAQGVKHFTGPATDEMGELAKAMNEAWFTFAQTGRPTSKSLPEWPAYDTDRRPTMVFSTPKSEVVNDPLRPERLLWVKET
ncbi:MAG: carboxylesterase/lipase family protein [Actinomycetota bacterium]